MTPDSLNPDKSPVFRVVAYATGQAVPASIPYEKLTHINYAFLLPKEDGTFQDTLPTRMLTDLVRLAHRQYVKVLISVGGWGFEKPFEALAATPSTRTSFVQNLVRLVERYKLDGVDMDWEYPEPGPASRNFLALMQELRIALPKGSLLTGAVVALGPHAPGIPDKSFALMDFVNLMAYDNADGPEHSSFAYAEASLEYWLGRGLPKEKAVLGVPFYARPTETAYASLVQADPSAAQRDLTTHAGEPVNYNGIPTMQAKTRLAMQRGSGIMFWRLENDAEGKLSLLGAIHGLVSGKGK